MIMSSFVKTAILRPLAETTSAGTEVGDWHDCDGFNQLIVALNVTAFPSRVDETLVVTVERWSPTTTGYTTLVTFTTINTTGEHTEEKIFVDGTTNVLGGRMRARCVTAGTWASKSITFEVKAYLKKA